MGDLIRPTKITLVTQEGECKLHIVIDLNINLNTNSIEVKSKKEEESTDEAGKWVIPTFASSDKVKFGNKEK